MVTRLPRSELWTSDDPAWVLAPTHRFPNQDFLVEVLEAWLRRHWSEWYEGPISELEHRDAIKEQAFGSAYATKRLEDTARYEVNLDRKLERTLSMLIRLRELRPPIVSG